MIATPKYSDTTHQMNYQYSYGCDGIGYKATTAREIRGELVFECLTGPLDVGGAMTARVAREARRGMGWSGVRHSVRGSAPGRLAVHTCQPLCEGRELRAESRELRCE